MRHVNSVLSLLLIPALFLGACATSSFEKVKPIDVQKELPKDIQDKFKIEEAPATPLPGAVQLPTQKSKVSRKKGSAKAFVYPNRRSGKDPIWLDEKLVYEITYFGLAAGTFTISVKPFVLVNKRKAYDLFGRAQTSGLFSNFYRVDDTVESYMDYEGLFSHEFHLLLDESKQTRDGLELYDSEKKKSYYWNRWNHYKKGHIETKDFFDMDPFPQDAISALYYLRTLPLEIGKSYQFPVVTEGKSWQAEAFVLRTEVTESPMGNVRCLVLRPETRFQGILKKTGESLFWVTDDDRHILVRVEAKVKIGTIVIQLKEAHLGTAP